jgi:hypothetical protein
MNDLFSDYPGKIKASTQRGDLWYARLHGLYAVHGPIPSQCSVEIVSVIEEGKLVVCRGDPTKLPAPCDLPAITPVYALGQSDVPAVPGGLILVRFSDHVQADSQRNALLQIGFVIDRVLPYALQAAWVRSAENDIAAALRGISELEALPEVVNVEPQMLMQAARRGAGTTLRE